MAHFDWGRFAVNAEAKVSRKWAGGERERERERGGGIFMYEKYIKIQCKRSCFLKLSTIILDV